MIEAGLEFEGAIDRVMTVFSNLPVPLRPVYFSHEEKLGRDAGRIEDQKRFATFIAKSASGFFLVGPSVTYSVRIATGKSMLCDCFIDVPAEIAKEFLEHMSKAKPIFGFACAPGERERRNRVSMQQGVNAMKSWVGRDTKKYVPGFYWLTLLSEALAEQHGVSLSAVSAVAQEHIELEGGQHLFRFYESPDDWETTSAVAKLCASLSGVFDVEKVKPLFYAAKNFLELNSVLREWK